MRSGPTASDCASTKSKSKIPIISLSPGAGSILIADCRSVCPRALGPHAPRSSATYIMKLKAEHSVPEWQTAMGLLVLVAENGGPTMLARISVLRALIPSAKVIIGASASWIISGLRRTSELGPLHPQERTSAGRTGMSVSRHDRKWPGAIHRPVGDNEWPLSAATGGDQRSLRRARSIRASTFGNMRVTG